MTQDKKEVVLINPRLTDYHGIHVEQASVDFAIPFFEEDIPLYLDPFLLWKSPSQQDQSLHTSLINAFNHLGELTRTGNESKAIEILITASECDEVGLGLSASRTGKRIGHSKAKEILTLFEAIPEYKSGGFRHFEEIQFFIEGISKDRISDIACSFLKSFLIDFTIEQCDMHGIPRQKCDVENIYDYRSNQFISLETVEVPANPENGKPLIFVPNRWLRYTPWISYDDYFHHYCPQDDIAHTPEVLDRVAVLNYNRENYGVIDAYIKEKERTFEDCHNDSLFSQIPVFSAKRKFNLIKKLPTGKNENADRKYEDAIVALLSSLLYPQLDFAAEQSRTESGVLIRDLIFYNNRSNEFFSDIFNTYDSKQIVFEMKNVKEISRDHINQLNRYMTDSLGRFGVLVTRNELKRARRQDTIDLWSGQRRCIITLTDTDIAQMVELFESRQRLPLDVIKKKYVEFRRLCPG